MSTNLTYEMLRERRFLPVGEETFFLKSLTRRVQEKSLLTTPEYQRGRVWTDNQASKYVGFLVEGGVSPPIFIQQWAIVVTDPTPLDELIDGLQRVTALVRFAFNEIPLETPRGERAFLHDFTLEDQKALLGPSGIKLTAYYVCCPTRTDVLELYLRLNKGGTPHTQEEIERVERLLQQVYP